MINITTQFKEGETRIEVQGHADRSEVCTAVSALTQGLAVALSVLAEQYPDDIQINK